MAAPFSGFDMFDRMRARADAARDQFICDHGRAPTPYETQAMCDRAWRQTRDEMRQLATEAAQAGLRKLPIKTRFEGHPAATEYTQRKKKEANGRDGKQRRGDGPPAF